MRDIVVDDNFISNHHKTSLENSIMSPSFKWEYVKWSVAKNHVNSFPNENTVDSFQFVNLFCIDNKKNSDFYEQAIELFYCFIEKHNIKVNNIVRGKCNLVLRPDNLTIPKENPNKHMMPHIDNSPEDKIFLYYVNDSDGDTIMFDNIDGNIIEIDRFSPRKGRAVMFGGDTIHAPAYPYISRERAVVNICFN